MSQPEPLTRLIEELQRLPGIGRKGAQRLAFHVLKTPRENADRLCDAIRDVKDRISHCSVCHNVTDVDPCPICTDDSRNRRLICVVEEASDIGAIERSGEYRGTYHVLGGRLAPIDGIGPDDLTIAALVARVGAGGIREVILATNAKLEGEATALYLQQQLAPSGVALSRIARGLPVGGDLEYADGVTIAQAITARRQLQ